MCWTSNKTPVFIKAKKDIEVYKLGRIKNDVFISQYRDYKYILNEKNPNIEIYPDGNKINEGYHSYSKNCFIEIADYYNIYCIKNANLNFVGLFSSSTAICIGKFIIPKGTTYCINSNGELVSENIIFVKSIAKKLLANKSYRFKYLECTYFNKIINKLIKLL